MKEEWKFYSFKGLDYEVSNFGNVIGLARGKMLKQRLNQDGYKQVTMGKEDSGRTSVLVHRLVAIIFIDNPCNLPEVNHKDFNRTNNIVTNLEWVTHKDNVDYTVKANRHISCNGGLNGEKNPNYNNDTLKKKYKNNPELAKEKNSRPKEQNGRAVSIVLYDINKNKIREFSYIGECAEYLIENNLVRSKKVHSIRTAITMSIKNNKPYLNYYFKYKENN